MKHILSTLLLLSLIANTDGVAAPKRKKKLKTNSHLVLWEKHVFRELVMLDIKQHTPLKNILVQRDSNVYRMQFHEVVMWGIKTGALKCYNFDLEKTDSTAPLPTFDIKNCKWYIFERWAFSTNTGGIEPTIISLALVDTTLPGKGNAKTFEDTEFCHNYATRPLFFIKYNELKQLLNQSCQIELDGQFVPANRFWDERMFASKIICIVKTGTAPFEHDTWVY